ncbi:MAG: hypothetical protein IH899_21345 [Planctomycetes bacterium]|nr:hypothetical protein [Planctomycetota bacterium]
MTDQENKLKSQLKEKEELVAALTERLEQAAEQLDRIHRTGGDRAGRTGGVLPLEMIEEQRSLTQNLQEVVTHWEESQPTEALGRIENHLIELRDLVTNQNGAGGFTTSASQQTLGSDGSGTSGLSGYEALKASMLSEDADQTHRAGGQSSEETAASIATEESEPVIHVELPEPESVDPPEAIDLETSDLDVLRQAVEVRDTFIGYLISKLKASESRAGLHVDWAALETAPEELRSRLEGLEERLEELLRLAEVELALERARLGREANRQEQLEIQIKRKMKKLGMIIRNDADPESDQADLEFGGQSMDIDESDEEDASQGNRWLRMLGR